MKLKPKAILFDMDGVLVDSLDAWLLALNSALTEYGKQPITREEFISVYWGHDLFDNIERMGLNHEIGNLCNTLYGENVKAITLYPQAIETLEHLSAYQKGLITNTPRDSAFRILKQFNMNQLFEVVITSDDVSRAKPDPEIVQKACTLLNVPSKEVVLIGDTESDVKAGKAANCIVIGINVKADYTISTVSEVLDLLDI